MPAGRASHHHAAIFAVDKRIVPAQTTEELRDAVYYSPDERRASLACH
jgi:hypothetical protein